MIDRNPTPIKRWAEVPVYIEAMKKMTVIAYSGGPLVKTIGNTLVRQGVPLACMYGSYVF
jgi:hypothetical protein